MSLVLGALVPVALYAAFCLHAQGQDTFALGAVVVALVLTGLVSMGKKH
jgi:hypothetical protein